ncbi:MAG: DUF6538 domain-containing protein [Pseudomonadota bacterium]
MLRRRDHWTVRVQVPRDLRPLIRRREVWRSTLTGDLKEAKLRAAMLRGHIGSLFTHLRKHGPRMSREQIDALTEQYLSARIEEIEERIAVCVPESDEGGRDAWADDLQEEIEDLELALQEGDYRKVQEDARRMLPQGSDSAVAILCRRLLEVRLEVAWLELKGLQGKPLHTSARLATRPAATPKKPTGPLLSKVCADYVETTSTAQQWTEGTKATNETAAAMLVSFLGDKPVSDITKADMTAAYLKLPRFPSNATKKYPGLSPIEALDAADAAKDEDRLHPRTCNIRLQCWKAIFRHAVGTDLIDKSRADHLKAFAEEGSAHSSRDAFTDDQLRAFFGLLRSKQETQPQYVGIPLAMLYAGLRLEEACALRGADIRQEQGVWVFDVNADAGHLKTKNAERLVPIHSAVLPYFLKARDSVEPEANLWGLERGARDRFGHEVSKTLNRRLKKAIPNKPDELVAYSLRHTFATRLKYADVQDHTISELMGHAVEALSVGRYGKKLEVGHLREAVEKLALPVL